MITKVLTNKSTKNEGPLENMGLNGKTLWRFQKKKKQKRNSRAFKNTKWKTRPLNPRYSGKYCASYKIISSGPTRLLYTQSFKIKDYLSTEEKIWVFFFSYYRVWQISRDNL